MEVAVGEVQQEAEAQAEEEEATPGIGGEALVDVDVEKEVETENLSMSGHSRPAGRRSRPQSKSWLQSLVCRVPVRSFLKEIILCFIVVFRLYGI